MKKILILISLLIVGAMGYYFSVGSQQATDELKRYVDREIKILEQNGFVIEDRVVEERGEHFVINYADPIKIAHYLKSKNVDISLEDSAEFKGVKIASDIKYLDGIYSAISSDIYPIAFPKNLMRDATLQDRKILDKILKDQIFLIHTDINKLFNSFRGYIKDINTTIESEDPLSIVSQGFKFKGDFDKDRLKSSSNSIEKISLHAKSGSHILLERLDGSYRQDRDSIYDYTSGYKIDHISYGDGRQIRSTLKDVEVKSSGESRKGLMFTKFDLQIGSADIKEPRGEHLLEEIKSKISIDNIAIDVLERMSRLDENDTKGFDRSFRDLLSKGIKLSIDELSVQKIKESNKADKIDGFDINATAQIDKSADFNKIEQNPLYLLSVIDSTLNIELSNKLYILLQREPELTLLSLMFQPTIKKDKVIFDIVYKNGSLKINGKPIL
jgi:hypothetical protein